MTGGDLREELRELAGELAWPPTPDLAAATITRLTPRPARAPAHVRWAPLRVALAVVLALVVVVAAVPPARSAVLDLLGITGGEAIVRTTTQPVAPPRPIGVGLGAATTLAAARAAVDFPVLAPASLGTPTAVRISRGIPGGMVSLVYGGRAVLSRFRGGATPYVRKTVGPGTTVRPVTVAGSPGYWVTGAPHALLLVDRDGRTLPRTSALVDANVLIWDRGGIAHRLETRGGLDDALAAARSLDGR